MREGGASGFRGVGVAVEVSGIGLIFGGILLDDGEAGNAEERVWLDLQSFEENVLVAAAALAIAAGPHQLQGALDAAQLVKRPGPHLHGEILLELGRGLIGEVGAHVGFPVSRQRRAQADQQQRPLACQFDPQCWISARAGVGGSTLRDRLAVWTRGCRRDGPVRDIRCSFFLGGAYRTTAHAWVTVRLILCNRQGGARSDSLCLGDGEET